MGNRYVQKIELIIGVVAVLSWVYLLLLRGRFWQVSRTLVPAVDGDVSGVRVAAVIPARDEAEVIGRSVTSLLVSTTSAVLDLIVVDDNSSDRTAEVAAEAAGKISTLATSGPGSCTRNDAASENSAVQRDIQNGLTVVRGRPLPPGWSGKLWAVEQGIEVAQQMSPTYFLLTDADIEHAPASIDELIALARAGDYDLASLMVKLHCRSRAEKLLIPAFVFFFFKLYPPAWTADPRRSTAGGAGGCILITPEALARAGGIAAIRAEIIDDCALARAVKRSGGRVYLGLAGATASLRAYGSSREIGRMIARTAFNQLHHSALLLFGALLGLAAVYLAPVALLFSGRALPTALGAIAWALMTALYLPMIRFYGLNAGWALTLPITALFYMAATVTSAVNYWQRRGGEWKGRVQDES